MEKKSTFKNKESISGNRCLRIPFFSDLLYILHQNSVHLLCFVFVERHIVTSNFSYFSSVTTYKKIVWWYLKINIHHFHSHFFRVNSYQLKPHNRRGIKLPLESVNLREDERSFLRVGINHHSQPAVIGHTPCHDSFGNSLFIPSRMFITRDGSVET